LLCAIGGGTKPDRRFAPTRCWSRGDSNRRSQPTKSVVYCRIGTDLFAAANIVVDERRASSSVVLAAPVHRRANLLRPPESRRPVPDRVLLSAFNGDLGTGLSERIEPVSCQEEGTWGNPQFPSSPNIFNPSRRSAGVHRASENAACPLIPNQFGGASTTAIIIRPSGPFAGSVLVCTFPTGRMQQDALSRPPTHPRCRCARHARRPFRRYEAPKMPRAKECWQCQGTLRGDQPVRRKESGHLEDIKVCAAKPGVVYAHAPNHGSYSWGRWTITAPDTSRRTAESKFFPTRSFVTSIQPDLFAHASSIVSRRRRKEKFKCDLKARTVPLRSLSESCSANSRAVLKPSSAAS
jgi:hypothetical protein